MAPVYIFDPTAHDAQSSVRGIGRYLEVLRKSGIDAVFTADVSKVPADSVFINPFFDPLKPPVITRRIARRQIAVIHDLIPLKYRAHFPTGLRGRFTEFMNIRAVGMYDDIIADSEASKKDIIKILGVDGRKISVIYPALSPQFATDGRAEGLAEKYKLPAKPYCIYVGDATWNKNLMATARAVQAADASCVIVGKVFEKTSGEVTHPWQRELKGFLEIVRADKRFVCTGFVDDRDLPAIYRLAAVNLLLSRDEGFGFSYVEASSQRVPSILSDIPIFREVAGDAAMFVDPDDSKAAGAAIRQILARRPEALARKAYTRSEMYSLENLTQQLKALLAR